MAPIGIAGGPKGSQMTPRGITGEPEGFVGSRHSLARNLEAPRWSPASTPEEREVIARDRDLPAWKSRVTREDRDLPAWNREPMKSVRDSSTWKRVPTPWNRDLPAWNRTSVKRDRDLPAWKSTSRLGAGAGCEEDRDLSTWKRDSRARGRDCSGEARDYSRGYCPSLRAPQLRSRPLDAALHARHGRWRRFYGLELGRTGRRRAGAHGRLPLHVVRIYLASLASVAAYSSSAQAVDARTRSRYVRRRSSSSLVAGRTLASGVRVGTGPCRASAGRERERGTTGKV
jgi:hypothetical protein